MSGKSAQRHQMLDGLVRGAVFAQPMESCVKMKSECTFISAARRMAGLQ